MGPEGLGSGSGCVSHADDALSARTLFFCVFILVISPLFHYFYCAMVFLLATGD